MSRWEQNAVFEYSEYICLVKRINGIVAQKTLESELVRCKECRHSFINENHPQKPRICGLTKKCGTTKDDWFCADGERREQ